MALCCQTAVPSNAFTLSRIDANVTYDVFIIRARWSPSPCSKASVTRRSGSRTCAGGLRRARSIRPTIPAFIPIASASVRIAAPGGTGWAISARTAETTSSRIVDIQLGGGGSSRNLSSRPASALARLFQIGIALETFFVELEQATGLLVRDASFADGELDVVAQLAHQHLRIELDVVEDLAHGVPLDHGVEDDVAAVVQAHVGGVGIAEQVWKVGQGILVRADEEHAEVVRLAVDRVERQRLLHVAAIDERVDLAVGVAGDVAEHRV